MSPTAGRPSFVAAAGGVVLKGRFGMRMTRATLVAAAVLVLPVSVRADDWPQWFGPQRDGVWRETGIVAALPKAGLPVKWRVPIGDGYSGPAVAGNRLFVLDRQPKRDSK